MQDSRMVHCLVGVSISLFSWCDRLRGYHRLLYGDVNKDDSAVNFKIRWQRFLVGCEGIFASEVENRWHC